MVYIHADPDRQRLTFKFVGRVSAMEMQAKLAELKRALERLESGFVLFTDLSELEFMENAATDQIAAFMDLCMAKGVGRIVRLIPHPAKDIGFALVGAFHYEKHIRTVTCENAEDAQRALQD